MTAALGIDIGGTSVKAASLHDDGTVTTARSECYDRPTRAQLIAAIRHVAWASGPCPGSLCDPDHGPDARATLNPQAIGLCVPGLLDRATRTVTQAVNVPGILSMPLDDLLAEALGPGLPRALLVTDAHATAHDLAVSRELSGRVFVLVLGTGIGAAVLDDLHPLHVDCESPGHFGQLDVSLDNVPVIGPDGGAGSLEGYVGARALAERYGSDFADRFGSLGPDAPPLRALARAIRIAHALYRPQHVCLAGGIGIRLAPLLPTLLALVDDRLTSIARHGWTLSAGDHDHHAATGAARLAAAGH